MRSELMAILSALSGQFGLGGGAQPFSGHNDMLLGSFGMPTSVAMPNMYNSNMYGMLGKIRAGYIEQEKDQMLQRIEQATGISSQFTGAAISMFPQLQGLVSTRADMLGGSFAFAQNQNPYLGTTLPTAGPAAENVYKRFEQSIYEVARGRMNDNTYRGIRSERDAGAVLSFATQTGQVGMIPRTRGADGRLEPVNAQDLTSQATEVLDRFDSLLEAGRKVFGPNAPAKQVLQRMRQLGGDVYSKEQADEIAARVQSLGATAFTSGANVNAVFAQAAQSAQQLQQFGLESRLAGDIAMSSAESAVRGAAMNRRDRAYFGEMGFNIGELNYKTLANAATADRLRYEARTGVQLRKAQMVSENLGMGGTAASAQEIMNRFTPEFINSMLTQEQQTGFTQEFTTDRAENLSRRVYSNLRASFDNADVNLGALDKFTKQRFLSGAKTGFETMQLVRSFKNAKPEDKAKIRAKLESIAGTSLSDADIQAMQTVDMTVGGMEYADIARQYQDVSEEELAEAFGDTPLPKTPIEAFLGKMSLTSSERTMKKLREMQAAGKVGRITELSQEQLKENKLDNLSQEELLDKYGIYKEFYKGEDGEISSRYLQAESFMRDGKKVTGADVWSEAGANTISSQAEALIEGLGEMLERVFGDIIQKAKEMN